VICSSKGGFKQKIDWDRNPSIRDVGAKHKTRHKEWGKENPAHSVINY
jgi:hypothetical protein